jgi:hypothetical protein
MSSAKNLRIDVHALFFKILTRNIRFSTFYLVQITARIAALTNMCVFILLKMNFITQIDPNRCARICKVLLETACSKSVLSSFWDTLYTRAHRQEIKPPLEWGTI